MRSCSSWQYHAQLLQHAITPTTFARRCQPRRYFDVIFWLRPASARVNLPHGTPNSVSSFGQTPRAPEVFRTVRTIPCCSGSSRSYSIACECQRPRPGLGINPEPGAGIELGPRPCMELVRSLLYRAEMGDSPFPNRRVPSPPRSRVRLPEREPTFGAGGPLILRFLGGDKIGRSSTARARGSDSPQAFTPTAGFSV